jgi:hypothetical protein
MLPVVLGIHGLMGFRYRLWAKNERRHVFVAKTIDCFIWLDDLGFEAYVIHVETYAVG